MFLGSFAFAHLLTWLLPNIFESWNLQIIDQFFLFRTNSAHFQPYYDDTIVHVDLNNSSVQKLKNFYLNRTHHAQVISNLSAMKVALVLHDFIFAAPSNKEEDRQLITAASKAQNVYFGLAFELSQKGDQKQEGALSAEVKQYLDETKWKITVNDDPAFFYKGVNPLITFPALSSVSRGLGFISIKSDRDGIYRRLPLLIKYGKSFYPSLPFRVICDYFKVGQKQIVVKPGKFIILQNAQRPGLLDKNDIIIPIDRYGNMIVNFIGSWERMKHYNFSDVLQASEDRDELEMWTNELKGKIVVLSEVTTGSSDVGPVPTDTNYPLSGLHANVMHTILTQSFVKEYSMLEMVLVEWLLLFSIFGLSIRYSSLPFSVGSVLIGVGYVFICATLFLYIQTMLHIVRPLLMMSFAFGSVLVYRYFSEEKEKAILRKSFEAYFPASIVKKLMRYPEMIATSGKKKELTILFSDIVNFTGYSANQSPDQVQKLLNEYFEAMTDIVFKYEGTVDKFMGDGLMVFFGDPEPQSDHALRCVQAAVEMQKKVKEIRIKLEEHGDMPVNIRVGINTGTVVVGNMGSTKRLSYTVIGSAVNLAQRLEANAPVGGILISQSTNELVKDKIDTKLLEPINIKGFDKTLAVYEVKF